MKALIVYNPFSGKQLFAKHVPYIVEQLQTKYEVVDVYRSPACKSIIEYVSIQGQDYQLIVVAGGDGTLNELINGVMLLAPEQRPIISYIPYGTVNDVGHMLKLKRNIKKAVTLILSGQVVQMDVCKIKDHHFIYALAAGQFTNISYSVSSKLKKRFGKMAYFLGSIKYLTKEEKIHIIASYDDQAYSGSCYVVIALNSQRVAGFSLFRKNPPKLNDGIIDVSFIENARVLPISLLNLCGFFLFGDRWFGKVKTIKTSEVKFSTSEEVAYNVDGEFAFKEKEASIRVIPKAISIIVNEKTKKKYF